MNIPFFKYYLTGNELKYMQDILENNKLISGDGKYTKLVHTFLKNTYGTQKALLTTSGTTALEMAMHLVDLQEGDEVIAPSFTFSSTINAILLAQKVKVIFADIDEHTLNIDPKEIKKKITSKTKAIMVVHYAGIACDMDAIMAIAKEHNLKVIEDAAQCIEAKYKNKYLGTIGDIGCFSFHETKNITSGEGGAICLNNDDASLFEKAEIMREKGTNRTKFIRGQVDKYTWVDLGSSYLPSDLLAAFLYAQLEQVKEITAKRLTVYERYFAKLRKFEESGVVKLPTVPEYATANGHIFYLLFKTEEQRNSVLDYLKTQGIKATFHYVPLHSAPYGRSLGYKPEDCPVTERVGQTLLRLPMYAQMTTEEQDYVIEKVRYALKHLNNLT